MSRPQTATPTEQAYGRPVVQRTNKMAVWALILSIITIGGLGSAAGIVLGYSARRRIAVTGERGGGLAVAAIVVGIVTLIFAIAYWAFLAMHTGGTGGTGGGGGGGGYRY